VVTKGIMNFVVFEVSSFKSRQNRNFYTSGDLRYHDCGCLIVGQIYEK